MACRRRAWRLLLGLVLLLAAGCGEPSPTVISGEAMGSRYHITLGGDHPSAEGLERSVAALFEAIEDQASQWRAGSWVSRFNASGSTAAVPVPAHAWAMLEVTDRVQRDSGGALDITAGPLVELWGFGAQPSEGEPSEMQIAQVLRRVGHDKLVMDRQAKTLAKAMPNVEIDLSSVGKGYAVDRIAALLDEAGVADYLIAFGGEVRARGDGPGGDGWVVGIDRPGGGALTLHDQAVATSGGAERYRETAGGSVVTHLVDPRTGRAVAGRGRSVTVVAERAAVADAWATALAVVRAEDRRALAQRGGVELVEGD